MQWIVASVGICVSIGLIALSMAINWSFGLTLGATPLASNIFGSIAVSLDGLKFAVPFFAQRSYDKGRYLSCIIALAIGVGCTFLSFTSAVGYSALNRFASAGEQSARAEDRAVTLTRLREAKKRLANVAAHRPEKVLESVLSAEMSNRRWLASKNCTNDTAAKSIVYCNRFRALRTELEVARSAAKLRSAITSLQSELKDSSNGEPIIAVDPQVTFLARLSGTSEEATRDTIIVGLALLLELATGFGCFLSVQYLGHTQQRPTKAEEPCEATPDEPAPRSSKADIKTIEGTSGIERFLYEATTAAPGKRVDAGALYAHYTAWSERAGAVPCTLTKFGTWLRKNGDLQKANRGGRVRYLDICLVEVPVGKEAGQ